MGCNNCYATGALVSSDYNVLSHGDIGAFYNSVANADLPNYTTMFYRPSQNEMVADVKYDKMEIGYDKGLRAMRDNAHGLPMEAYIPRSIIVPDNASACPSVVVRNADVMPKRTIIDEILQAHAEVVGKKDAMPGEAVVIRTTEIEQHLHLMRRLRRVEIFKKRED